MKFKHLVQASVAGLGALVATAATAAPLCTGFSSAADFVCTYDGQRGNTNDNATNVAAAYMAATGDPVLLALYGKSDNPGANALFTFGNGILQGDNSFDFVDPSTNVDVLDNSLLFPIITVKAGNEFNLYYFADGINAGDVLVDFVNRGGKTPDISHISFWNPFDVPPRRNQPPLNQNVPAPGALGLIGLGVLAIALRRRRA